MSPKQRAGRGYLSPDGEWRCDCERSERDGKQGCQKEQGYRCGFFLWADEASGRELKQSSIAQSAKLQQDKVSAKATCESEDHIDVMVHLQNDTVDSEWDKLESDDEFQPPQSLNKTGDFNSPIKRTRMPSEPDTPSSPRDRYGSSVQRENYGTLYHKSPEIDPFTTPQKSKTTGVLDSNLVSPSPSKKLEQMTMLKLSDSPQKGIISNASIIANSAPQQLDIIQKLKLRLLAESTSIKDQSLVDDICVHLDRQIKVMEGFARGRNSSRQAVAERDSTIALLKQRVTLLETEVQSGRAVIASLRSKRD